MEDVADVSPLGAFVFSQFTNQLNINQAGLFFNFAEQSSFDSFTWLNRTGGHLRSGLGMVAVIEDEQLRLAVTEAGEVGEDFEDHK